jgi:hypothetical protein
MWARTQASMRSAGSAPVGAPGAHTSTQCEVYADKLVVTRRVGAVATTTQALQLTGDLLSLVQLAAQGSIDAQASPPDGPTCVSVAALRQPGQEVRYIDLGSTYSGVRTTNGVATARGLKAFLDLHCPVACP